MITNALDGRLRALEDEFFRQVDLKLCEQLREKVLRDEARSRLARLVNIDDTDVLDELLLHGINDQTVPVLLLVPLVFVAWSDGRITDAERGTVMSIVSRYLKDESPEVLKLIDNWLDRKPSEKLWDAWQAYIEALREQSSGTVWAILSETLIEHANRVAEASTSYLSFKRICAEKQEALARLSEALQD
ncbi:hypothetical protein Q31b_20290 [Novipirellula aureliae]|uniref:Tellurite resistance protein TerB n=1 Tax=Novipirellula aureliae TaxID=2527966 RepID=A0A5C6E2P8_9BACT|nr:hypothetical protein [Novipirellula aureliae]TWU42995.1 hypothetical protein Q31b_20290 [Novipirellula aureliae]